MRYVQDVVIEVWKHMHGFGIRALTGLPRWVRRLRSVLPSIEMIEVATAVVKIPSVFHTRDTLCT